MWTAARQALHSRFGHERFRPGQREAVACALRGLDALVVMPTGGGKSLCFQVPALVRPGLTLVISPLIALMKDQVAHLERFGVPAALINSTLSAAEIEERLRRAVQRELKLLYVAPERFDSPRFRDSLARMNVGLVAIDEAHCVSQWGHDFRPSYLKLRRHWPRLGQPPLLALTATATPEVREAIVRDLGLRNPKIIVRGFDRPNLHWSVRREERTADRSRALLSLLRTSNDGSAIVYASTRKMVEAAAELLRSAGIQAVAYHAGLDLDRRTRAQDDWTGGRVNVVVATNAFGMGIDKNDVRIVIHVQMPSSLEAYYQEAGRAGRDGEPARCVLLHSYRDRFTHEFLIRCSHPPRKVVRSTYRSLVKAHLALGEPVAADRVRVAGVKSQREVESALRILADHGAVRRVATRPRFVVRMIAGSGELDAALASDALPGSASTRTFAASLFALFRERGVTRMTVGERELTELGIARVQDCRAALQALQRSRLIGWRDTGRAGFEPATAERSIDEWSIDWERVAERRGFELLKLKRMERYAFGGGCRRRHLLRYFGERPRGSRCRNCDACRGDAPGSELAPRKKADGP